MLNTTVIHHPAGDLMKISKDLNSPALAAWQGAQCWQLDLDLGHLQGGSSGAPYFNQNHQIIGQHYGRPEANLRPICDITVTMGGRFDLSWRGDGTIVSQLSSWLDPNNTGTITTNTTNVSALQNSSLSNLSISGDNSFCSGTRQYELIGAPSGLNVSWVSSNPNVASVESMGNPVTITKGLNPGGFVTITATVGGNCFSNNKVSKTIHVGVPDNTQLSVWSSANSVCPNLPMPFVATYQNRCDLVDAEWDITPAGAYVSYNSGYPCINENNTGVTISFPSTGTYYVKTRVRNACGWSSWSQPKIIQVTCSGGASFTVAPNPANSTITIQQKEKSNATIHDVRIFDNSGSLKKQSKFSGLKQVQLYVADLKEGVYFVEITSAENKERQLLLIQR